MNYVTQSCINILNFCSVVLSCNESGVLVSVSSMFLSSVFHVVSALYNRLFFSGVQILCLAILFFTVNCDFIKFLVLLSIFWPAVYFVSTSLVYLPIFLPMINLKSVTFCRLVMLQAWACVLLFALLVDFLYLFL